MIKRYGAHREYKAGEQLSSMMVNKTTEQVKKAEERAKAPSYFRIGEQRLVKELENINSRIPEPDHA